MLKRTVTGLISAAVLIALLYVRGPALDIALAVVAILGSVEMIKAFEQAGVSVAAIPVYCMAILMLPAYLLASYTGFYLVTILTLLWIALCIIFREKPVWTDVAASVCVPVFVLIPISLFYPLIRITPDPIGALMALLAFLIAYLGDTCAFFIGVLFGKRKLAPMVSPKKTREGAVAGLVGSVCGAALIFVAGSTLTELPPLWHFIPLGLVGGIAGQLGDLSASMIKRFCGVKDFGTLFPGHGGMLDRLDSVLFVVYIAFGYTLLTGML
ncbi:MAG: phosphatidate cytidylyltransferase [Clostridia bacterium]|nr:phosphatidate cytidylyltransferase [Clostridia bacterium]